MIADVVGAGLGAVEATHVRTHERDEVTVIVSRWRFAIGIALRTKRFIYLFITI